MTVAISRYLVVPLPPINHTQQELSMYGLFSVVVKCILVASPGFVKVGEVIVM